MLKKSYSLTHTSKTFNINQYNLYKYRLENINLTWVNQVLDIVEKYDFKTIKDIGCNYFQFYKELKIRKFKKDYFGYDIDQKFVNLGLTKFPELKNKYKIGNCEKIHLKPTDLSVISAVLEHSVNPYKLLKNVLGSTKKVICIRTFLDKKSHNAVCINKKGQLLPYNSNQFSYSEIEKLLNKFQFKCFFLLDKATNYSTKFEIINKKYKRTMYVVLGVKK